MYVEYPLPEILGTRSVLDFGIIVCVWCLRGWDPGLNIKLTYVSILFIHCYYNSVYLCFLKSQHLVGAFFKLSPVYLLPHPSLSHSLPHYCDSHADRKQPCSRCPLTAAQCQHDFSGPTGYLNVPWSYLQAFPGLPLVPLVNRTQCPCT